jgi:molecular chaperone DnaJ
MGIRAPRFTAGGRGQPGGFDDIFGGMFGQGAGAPGGARGGYQGGTTSTTSSAACSVAAAASAGGFRGPVEKGRDVTATTTLDFESAINGDTVRCRVSTASP